MEQTKNLYDILEISQNASEEEIKRAFRKQALKYHPDKAGNSPEAVMQYDAVQRAHQILSDSKQRQIYDKYGEAGLSTFSQMGEFAPFLDPSALPQLHWLLFAISIGLCLLIVSPVLLALKIDQNFATYTIALSPLFLIDFVIYVLIISSMFIGVIHYEGDSRSEMIRGLIFKGLVFVYFGLIGAFEILLAIKLDGIVEFNWWGVFTPLLLWELMNFIMIMIPTVIQSLERVYEEEMPEGRRHTIPEVLFITIGNFYFFSLRFIQQILIIFKIGSGSDVNWALIFLPMWILGFVELLKVLAEFIRPKSPEHSGWPQFFVFAFWATLFFAFLGLLTTRLNSLNGLPPVMTILVPLFIVLSLLVCCSSCVLPSVLRVQKEQFDEEMASRAAGGSNTNTEIRTIVAIDHRIAPSDGVLVNQNQGCRMQ